MEAEHKFCEYMKLFLSLRQKGEREGIIEALWIPCTAYRGPSYEPSSLARPNLSAFQCCPKHSLGKGTWPDPALAN